MKKSTFLAMFIASFIFYGCKDNSAVDELIGETGTTIEVEVPVKLQITMTSPSAENTQVGYLKKVGGSCSPVGKVIEVSGDAIGYSVCENDSTWEAEVDFSGSAVGVVSINAYVVDGDNRSAAATKTFNKDNIDCDDPAKRAETYANSSSGGNGGANPWFICNSVQLNNVRLNRTHNYIIKNDLYLNGTPVSAIPEFTGSLQGNNFEINDLVVNDPTSWYSGLFQRLAGGAVVQNIIFNNVKITGRGTAGIIAGRTRNGSITISNISVNNSNVKTVTNAGAGGLIGYAESTTSGLNFSDITLNTLNLEGPSHTGGVLGYSHGSMTGAVIINNVIGSVTSSTGAGYAGGVVGLLDHANGGNSITNTTITYNATNSGNGNYMGGVVGRIDAGSIDTCSVTTTVNASGNYIGGVAGRFSGTNLHNCTATSTINVDVETYNGHYVGGLVGEANLDSTYLLNCSVIANITASGVLLSSYYGGIAGRLYGGTVNNCHVSGVDSSTKGTVTIINGNGLTTGGQYYGGAFGAIYARQGNTLDVDNVSAKVDVNVTTTQNEPYVGGWAGQISAIDPSANSAATITIDSAFATGNVTAKNRRVAGFAGNIYAGRGGSSVSITDAYATGNVSAAQLGTGRTVYYIGGFAGSASTRNSNGDTQNPSGGLHFDRVHATGNVYSEGQQVGGLIGVLSTGRTSVGGSTSTVTDSYYSGDITVAAGAVANDFIGGLVGYAAAYRNSTLTFSTSTANSMYAQGTISGTSRNYVGGLIGRIYGEQTANLNMTDMHTNITVSGTDYVGGAIGDVYSRRNTVTNITDIQSTGNVTGEDYTGGLFGRAYAETGGGFNDSTINISNVSSGVVGSPVTSTLSSSNQYAGGLIGYFYGGANRKGLISNAKAYMNVTSTSNSYIGGFIGRINAAEQVDGGEAYGSVVATNGIYIGGFSGQISALGNNLINSLSKGDVTVNYDSSRNRVYVAGFTGYVSSASVRRSYSEGDVVINLTGAGTINESRSGGFVGQNTSSGLLAEVYALGDFTVNNMVGNNYYVGGLVGYASGPIVRSFAAGNVVGGQQTGGLVGRADSTITDAFAAGNVTGVRYVGGLVGYSNGSSGAITRTYATGSLTRHTNSSYTNYFGQIVGRVPNSDRVVDSFYHTGTSTIDVAITTPYTNGNTNGLASMLTANQAAFTNFDFTNATGTTDDDWAYTSSWQIPGSGSAYEHPLPGWFQALNP